MVGLFCLSALGAELAAAAPHFESVEIIELQEEL